MKLRLSHVIAAALVACCALVGGNRITAQAAVPSPFDTTFGDNGITHLHIPLQRSRTYAKSVVSDANGRVLALFHIDEYSNDPKLVIGRSSADGVPDTTFGTDGGTEPIALQSANLAVIASSGRILVAGYQYKNGRVNIVVYNFTAAGVIDRSFGTDGYYEIQGLPGRSIGWSSPLIASTSSNIFLGFETGNTDGTNLNYHFVALDHSGALDSTWGNGGGREVIPVAPGGASAWSSLHAMTTLSDGSLLAVGAGYTSGSGRQIVLVKLTPNGYLDQTFDGSSSGNGLVKVSFATETDAMMTAITVLQDDGFVLAGQAGTYYYGPWYYGMAKFLPTGIPDTTFGTNGFALSSLGNAMAHLPMSVSRQSDGKYLFPVGEGSSMGFMRVQANGTFSSAQGCFKCLWSQGGVDAVPYSLLLQSSGKIIVVGARLATGSSNAAAVRFLADGTVDSSFATEWVYFDLQRWESWGVESVPQPDGSIIVLGQARHGSATRAVVFKLTPSGALDPTFGSGGYRFLYPPTDDGVLVIRDIDVLTNGKIVALAWGRDSNINLDDSIFIWRLNADGSPDNTFGTGGRTVTSDAQAQLSAGSLVSLSTGKTLVSVTRSSNADTKPWIFRYLPSGVLDTTFTDSNNFAGGIQPTPGDGDGEGWNIYDAGNDNSYLTGRTSINGVDSVFMTRVLPDGTNDPVFAGGRATWAIGQADSLDGINDVFVGSDGRITISGWVSSPTSREVIIRLQPNGTLNTEFNGTGRSTYLLRDPANIDWVGTSSVISTSNGVMVVGGGAIDQNSQFNFLAAAKFTPTGTLDGTFGTAGVVLSNNTFNGSLNDIVPLGSTSNLATGFALINGRSNAALMKISTATTPPTTTPPTTNPPSAPSTAPATTVPANTASTDDNIKLAVSTTQTAILKKLKITVPKGGKVSMKSSSAKVCRVSGTKVIATSSGTCRINVTVTVKGKKSTKTLAIKVT